MNIYEKLLAITSEMSAVNKNLVVGEGKSQYKAVGEADVLAAVKKLEAKYKIYSYPCDRQVLLAEMQEREKTYNGQTTKSYSNFLRIETTYRFVNVEDPKEFIEIKSYGDGVDTQDKAPGKAMTYSDKYALLKAYKMITGDDPDQYASPDTVKPASAGTKKTALQKAQDEIRPMLKEVATIIGSTPKETYNLALMNLDVKGETLEDVQKIKSYLEGLIRNAKDTVQ